MSIEAMMGDLSGLNPLDGGGIDDKDVSGTVIYPSVGHLIGEQPSKRRILKFAEMLIHRKTDTYCSELQRQILIAALQEERKTYDQLAEECGYSPKYVKQDVAPKLWQLLSQVLDTKVTKANVRVILANALKEASTGGTGSATALSDKEFSRQDETDDDAISDVIQLETADSEIAEMSGQKGTILLVDDQPQNLRLLSDLLEEQGYEVQQAINGSVALQVVFSDKTATTQQPDLILLDINMPDVDGYSVCQQIKSARATQDIPIIFISALDEAWDKVRAFSVGGSDYISKPFKVVEVLARVENQLKIKRLQSSLRRKNQQLQQAIQELQRLAAIDKLTHVASLRRFDEYLLNCWRRSIENNSQITLMFIQLNHSDLYPPNSPAVDSDGAAHPQGDRILHQIAQLIQNAMHTPQSLTCRYGTLTFATCLPQRMAGDASPASPSEIAECLLQEIQQVKSPWAQHITANIGLAIAHPSADATLEALLETGDQALYQARQQQNNCIVALEL